MSAADLLPPNATPFEGAESATDGQRILAAPTDLVRTERQPDTCDAAFVAPLAWERSVHHWFPGDDPGNRARIASSFADHAAYGAPAALETEISLDTGYAIRIREFFQIPGGVWPGFDASAIINPGDANPNLAAVDASALNRKNVRDLYEGARIFVNQPPALMSVGAACAMSTHATVLPLDMAISPAMTVGAAIRVVVEATVLPLRLS